MSVAFWCALAAQTMDSSHQTLWFLCAGRYFTPHSEPVDLHHVNAHGKTAAAVAAEFDTPAHRAVVELLHRIERTQHGRAAAAAAAGESAGAGAGAGARSGAEGNGDHGDDDGDDDGNDEDDDDDGAVLSDASYCYAEVESEADDMSTDSDDFDYYAELARRVQAGEKLGLPPPPPPKPRKKLAT